MYMIGITSSTCDACRKSFRNEVGVQAVAQGATGRYCAVMWFCRKCSINGEAMGHDLTQKLISYDDLEEICRKNGGWVDDIYPTSKGSHRAQLVTLIRELRSTPTPSLSLREKIRCIRSHAKHFDTSMQFMFHTTRSKNGA